MSQPMIYLEPLSKAQKDLEDIIGNQTYNLPVKANFGWLHEAIIFPVYKDNDYIGAFWHYPLDDEGGVDWHTFCKKEYYSRFLSIKLLQRYFDLCGDLGVTRIEASPLDETVKKLHRKFRQDERYSSYHPYYEQMVETFVYRLPYNIKENLNGRS